VASVKVLDSPEVSVDVAGEVFSVCRLSAAAGGKGERLGAQSIYSRTVASMSGSFSVAGRAGSNIADCQDVVRRSRWCKARCEGWLSFVALG
jgi:hypothetical protein